MKKLGESLSLLMLIMLAGSSTLAVADPLPFEYQPVQVIYIEEESFAQKYQNAGVLEQLALEYEAQMIMEELRAETIGAKAELVKNLEEAEADLYYSQQVSVDKAIAALWPFVDKTPYGFGNTPIIWDCSGLTQWYLHYRGIENVIHSATSQVRDTRSKIVEEPIAGDLVAFQRAGATYDYFHIGVYIGGGYMIHASNPQKGTNLQLVTEFAESENSKVIFIRF